MIISGKIMRKPLEVINLYYAIESIKHLTSQDKYIAEKVVLILPI